MNYSSNRIQLTGIVPPLVTPLLASNQLDANGLERLIEHVINGGVSGIFILGTTGESSRLSGELKDKVIQTSCKIVNKRVPVLVGISHTSFHETLRLENIAAKAGADAVVLAPPYYYHIEQDELNLYYHEIAEAIQLPLYMYNVPSKTHINISINTALEAAKHHRILGMKDSSGDLVYIQSLLYSFREESGFSVFIGPEEIMPQSVLLGASGGINGGANIYPRLYVELYKAARAKDLLKINQLQQIVTQLSNTLYTIGADRSNPTKIIKEVLFQKKICGPLMEKPSIALSQDDQRKITECLDSISLPASCLD